MDRTTMRVEQIEIPAVDMGQENPLPYFQDPKLDVEVWSDEKIPPEDRERLGWQAGYRVLPYRLQDGYGRKQTPRKCLAVVMENEHLRATILPVWGGRITSLFHKTRDLELTEPVLDIQPVNIALRNAWFAGGIEWNLGHPGHDFLTCAPLFAARLRGPNGDPVLRLYEWDRVKCVPFQVDLHLPSGSQFLYAYVRIVNPATHEIPMYWWTNIAPPQTPDRRVLAPADTAIHNAPEGMALTDVPRVGDVDFTYSTNIHTAKEMFFIVPRDQRPWIACVDGGGRGIVQTSTSRLIGRKFFAWGKSPGGDRWQLQLMGPGREYLEIQAGLARTQLESIPMPAKTEWTWTEAFGLLEADPAKLHSPDWTTACSTATEVLETMLPSDRLNDLHVEFGRVGDSSPDEILATADGWGALERLRATAAGEPDPVPPALPLETTSLGPDQQQWLSLLRDGVLPEHDTMLEPGHYMIQPEWQSLLEKSIAAGPSDHWLGWLHLGVMKLEHGDVQGATDAWTRSIAKKPSGWAYRNLSMLESRAGNIEAACDQMREAWEAGPPIVAIAQEYADLIARTERWETLREHIASMPEEVRSHERLLLASAKLALHDGDLDRVAEVLDHEFATIREGEISLSDIWYSMQERLIADREGIPIDDALRTRVRRELTPPRKIDFRMITEDQL